MRISAVEELILGHLSGRSMYGLELVVVSKGRLKRGTVYVTLQRMEGKGYIESHQQPATKHTGGLPRRLYRPTALGRRVLAAARAFNRILRPEHAT